ncbi:hypothetical protein TSUD_132380 [Trifolium subterraneum]|uniref:UDP-glycosyltransferases domain-containing protein n=1 Tax=Trifolium subterraneum TaxID=3900 RepID=A0A2Z6LVI4_TRISU|nr:hypothetical protein TSUD_132380 [Trifolium subterraneum]
MSNESIHVAMFPSAGMGHLTPFLRLASLLLTHHCKVTLITPLPTISHAESQLLSNFHSSFPQLNLIPFHLPPPPSPPISGDPFFLRVQTLRNSTHLLPPLISSLSPPLSLFISDIFLLSPLISVTQKLSLPNYILFTSSASMFSFFSHFPTLAQSKFDNVDQIQIPVPGMVSPLPYSSIPPFLFQPTIFRSLMMEDSPNLTKLHGVFLNTFEALESHSLKALNDGKVVKDMPPVYAVGPFVPFEFEKKEGESSSLSSSSLSLINWLDDQPIGSVVYVCFGSRTALGRDQMREIGNGLMKRDEIGDAIKEIMENELLKVKAMELKEGGRKAISVGGDCDVTIQKLIQKWKNDVNNV